MSGEVLPAFTSWLSFLGMLAMHLCLDGLGSMALSGRKGPGRKAPLLGLVQKRQQSLWETKAENQLSIPQTVSG